MAVASAVTLSSCASINVDALPQPGNAYRDGYDLVIEFKSALNLPDRAKVVLDGTSVGVVTRVAATTSHADVTVRIGANVTVPSNIHAALQQATVLGDIYVALDRPENDHSKARALGPGGKIPLTNTTSPPELEDTIASLANFVSSGSIQRIQNTIIGINRVAPEGGQDAIRKLASQVAGDLSGLADNIKVVDELLNSVSATAEVMHNRLDFYRDMLSPAGLLGNYRTQIFGSYISVAIPTVGSLLQGGYWLVPLLHSLADGMDAMRQSKWSFEREYPEWQRLFTQYFLPQDKYPAINITSIVGPDGRELSGDVQEVLRILGAAP